MEEIGLILDFNADQVGVVREDFDDKPLDELGDLFGSFLRANHKEITRRSTRERDAGVVSV